MYKFDIIRGELVLVAQGEKGDTGETGATGANGTNGTDGADGISFIWEDAYVAETTYAPNDVVSYNGSSYICILASTGNLPTNTTYWALMAQAGAGAVTSVNGADGVVVLDSDDIDDTDKNHLFVSSTEKSTWNGKAAGDHNHTGTYEPADATLQSSKHTHSNSVALAAVSGTNTGDQDISGKEDTSNKKTSLADNSDTYYPTQKAVKTAVDAKEATANKVTSFQATPDDTHYASEKLVKDSLDGKASKTGTETLTNKRITQRVQSVSDAATITPDADANDCVDITAVAQAFTIANPSGTPTNFQKLIIRIKDNGTARAITWGNGYVAGGVALPSTTVLSKILNLGFQYNTANSLNKWQLIASSQEA